MRFSYDPETHSGTSCDGCYTIELRGERYGKFLDISFGGELIKTVWVRENQRPVRPIAAPLLYGEKTVLEWVVDNNAGTGADTLLTLNDQVGNSTLGELLKSFFDEYEEWRIRYMSRPERPWPRMLVRIGCRGNQRGLMEDRHGP